MAKYVFKPFEYLDNVIGVEINFNKVFYKPVKLEEVATIITNLDTLEKELKKLVNDLAL
jgi:type I restriction enzyme M protein